MLNHKRLITLFISDSVIHAWTFRQRGVIETFHNLPLAKNESEPKTNIGKRLRKIQRRGKTKLGMFGIYF